MQVPIQLSLPVDDLFDSIGITNVSINSIDLSEVEIEFDYSIPTEIDYTKIILTLATFGGPYPDCEEADENGPSENSEGHLKFTISAKPSSECNAEYVIAAFVVGSGGRVVYHLPEPINLVNNKFDLSIEINNVEISYEIEGVGTIEFDYKISDPLKPSDISRFAIQEDSNNCPFSRQGPNTLPPNPNQSGHYQITVYAKKDDCSIDSFVILALLSNGGQIPIEIFQELNLTRNK